MARNTFVFAMLLGLGLLSGGITGQEARVPFVYVSGYRPEIAIFRLDTGGAALVPVGNGTNVGQEPSFLAVDPVRKSFCSPSRDRPGRVRRSDQSGNGALKP